MTDQSNITNTRKRSWLKKLVYFMWGALLLGVLAFALILFIISKTRLPDTKQLENPTFEYATKIYSQDGREFGRYFRKNRDWVEFDQLSPHLVNALVATEDERFYKHSGIDTKGTLRAIFYFGKKGGASTVSQQLSKLLFTKRSRNFIKRVFQKFREWIIAVRIEKQYTKGEIIAMYLNKFDFLYDSNGIGAAAKTYFGKDQSQLNIEEAAILIGMLKNPYIFNPHRVPKKAKKRRMVVLHQMLKNEFITKAEYDSLKVIDLDMSKFQRQEDSKGIAPYFRSELTKWVKDLLKKDEYLKPDGTPYNIYVDGLKIYTTIDYKMQIHAEKAVRKNLKKVQERYWKVWKNKDPWTYKADDYQKTIRKNSLNSLVRQSERYQFIRDNYMSSILADLELKFPEAKFRDVDMIRMAHESKKKGHFVTLLNKKYVTKNQVNMYKDIMNSAEWKVALKQWRKMENAVRKSFMTPQKMRVFAYNNRGVKDTIMTPMDSIRYYQMHMQSGMLGIEPSTGYVRTWVGGVDHNSFQYDHVTSNRQVGSTFKPFIYTTAIFQQGISPCWKVKDMQYTIPARDKNFGLMKAWNPSNARGTFSGKELTLYEGLKQSKNSVSVWLMKELGNVDIVKDLTTKMGIPRKKIPNSPSICLGTPELSLIDMTSAYTTFANDGVHNEPIFVTRIEDKDGQVIYNAVPEQQRVLPKDYNYVMVDMLKYAAKFIQPKVNVQIGGKTGTTNDYVDGWFIGITPNLVVGTWVGGDNPWIRFTSLRDGQGGVMARPAFVNFLERVEADTSIPFDSEATFKEPENMEIEVNCNKYQEALDALTVPKKDTTVTIPDDVFDEDM